MIVKMDLNALPEEEEETYDRHVHEYAASMDRPESANDIANREPDERRKRLKRERGEERAINIPQRADQFYHAKHFKSYDKSKFPSGWLYFPSFGQEIECFIPSKAPLGESFNECIPPGKRYSFKQVIHQQRVLGRKLGLVIDLTNTSRYYSTSDLKKEGIKHVKIACVGRDAVPNNAQVNEFVYEAIKTIGCPPLLSLKFGAQPPSLKPIPTLPHPAAAPSKMAEGLDDAEFWLPSQFLTEEDFIFHRKGIAPGASRGNGVPLGGQLSGRFSPWLL
ncbi:hypothetical protein SAY87_023902 [Trapa incisa]|uniref:Uncharacterized protein n=1 Tax=Trapa incisa TaxID=236973 RepID=A0AAN7L771_9MYRT|nr:hypothetical protein SAY87_023902 [Trapa incisa]